MLKKITKRSMEITQIAIGSIIYFILFIIRIALGTLGIVKILEDIMNFDSFTPEQKLLCVGIIVIIMLLTVFLSDNAITNYIDKLEQKVKDLEH